jgi:hypothetical protein
LKKLISRFVKGGVLLQSALLNLAHRARGLQVFFLIDRSPSVSAGFARKALTDVRASDIQKLIARAK